MARLRRVLMAAHIELVSTRLLSIGQKWQPDHSKCMLSKIRLRVVYLSKKTL